MHFKSVLMIAAAAGLLLAAVPGHAAGQRQAVAALTPPVSGPAPDAPADAAAQTLLDQVRGLEKQLQMLMAEARHQQDQLALVRQHLAAAESMNNWLPWLVLGLAVTGALALWLALRVRRLQRELTRQAWTRADAEQRAAAAAMSLPSAAAPLLSPDQPLLSGQAPGDLRSAAAVDPPRPMSASANGPAIERTAADFSVVTAVPPRPVSVEELLDLEQQVDFFLVLGQEQAATDLLLGHVRSTGGSYALPYVKLLEIYRRQGDEEAYDRTRDRFNQRFNAVVPGWDGDLHAGRALEDYPEVLARLQRAWAHPLRAVAEIESLLLRRADLEPFDLPAYRELLMLHALVRDLPAQPLPATAATLPSSAQLDEGVDLLLPLDERKTEASAPRPRLAERTNAQVMLAERTNAQAMLAEWVYSRTTTTPRPDPARPADAGELPLPELRLDMPVPGGRVDVDLSDFAPAPREFTRPAAFTDIDLRRERRRSEFTGLDGTDLPDLPSAPRRH